MDFLWSFLRNHLKMKVLVFFSTCKQVSFFASFCLHFTCSSVLKLCLELLQILYLQGLVLAMISRLHNSSCQFREFYFDFENADSDKAVIFLTVYCVMSLGSLRLRGISSSKARHSSAASSPRSQTAPTPRNVQPVLSKTVCCLICNKSCSQRLR